MFSIDSEISEKKSEIIAVIMIFCKSSFAEGYPHSSPSAFRKLRGGDTPLSFKVCFFVSMLNLKW